MARRRRQAPPPPRHPPTTTQASNRNNTTTNRSQQWTPQRLLSSSYQDLGSPQDVAMNFQNCLLNSPQTLTSLLSILLNEPGKTGIFDYSLQVDIHDFISMDPVLGNMLLRHPAALISVLEEAIVNAQREILKRWNDFQDLAKLAIPTPTSTSTSTSVPGLKGGSAISSYLPVVKGEGGTRVHARLVHLPPHFTNCKPSLASLTSHDVGKILQLSGTVVRTSRIQMYESQRAFQCSEKKGCGTRFTIKADLTQWNNALTVPSR
jgi:DNA replicative helicase MCM subunit Mcm2 (Cdc46/Mcm family)